MHFFIHLENNLYDYNPKELFVQHETPPTSHSFYVKKFTIKEKSFGYEKGGLDLRCLIKRIDPLFYYLELKVKKVSTKQANQLKCRLLKILNIESTKHGPKLKVSFRIYESLSIKIYSFLYCQKQASGLDPIITGPSPHKLNSFPISIEFVETK